MKRMLPFLAAALAVATSPVALAQHQDSTHSPHGGSSTEIDGFRFETVLHRDQVLIYAWDGDHKPIDPRGASGSIQVAGDGLTARRAEIRPVTRPDVCLGARIDLSRIEDGAAEANIEIHGLGKDGRHVAYKVDFRLARLVEYVCPMKDSPPQTRPGRCSKCGMELELETAIYACPRHPGATSRRAGDTCWICRARMERRTDRDPGAGGHGGHGH